MNRSLKKISTWLLGAAFALVAFGATSQAATSQNMDITVSISRNKSVLLVGNTTYSFGALAVNTSSVSVSSFTFRNDSTVFIETYTITGANAISDTGGTNWTLAASAGADQYALAAQFANARPADNDSTWNIDDLTTSAQTCSENRFGNGTEAQAGSNVAVSADRFLWIRIKTPTSVTDATQHTVTMTLSVL